MARAEVILARSPQDSGSDTWSDCFSRWGLPAPDATPLQVEGRSFSLVWRSHLVVASTEDLTAQVTEGLEALGFSFVVVGETGSADPPAELVEFFGGD
jgi:hypothetical protein